MNKRIEMENKLFTLLLTSIVALSTTVYAQQPPVHHSSVQVAFASKRAAKSRKPAVMAKTTRISLGSTDRQASPASNRSEYTAMEQQQLATFVFVVNRGEMFAFNAPGELTELSLSGFTTDALPTNNEGAMNETASRNSVTLTGAVTINEYSPEPSTNVIASLRLRPLTATRGLMVSLTIDKAPLRVLLPFDSGDCRWRGGYTYKYVLTLNGGVLQVTGMTVRQTTK